MAISVTVSAVGKPPSFARGFPLSLDIHEADPTIASVKSAIAARYPKFYSSRQKITIKGDRKLLADDIRLDDIVANGTELSVKDLGPQISWQTVFIVEYSGPLIVHPLLYHFPTLFYGVAVEHSMLQKFVYAFVMLHFLKREIETMFVHRFSHATMPARNIFKNSAHYHLLSGLALAYDAYRPAYSAKSLYGTLRGDPRFIWAGAALCLFAELSNLWTHLTLRSLRPTGTHQRAIPYGYGFTYLSVPNYFFESLAWVILSAVTGSWAAWLFTVIAIGQMILWAVKKHNNYKKEFGKAYPRRWAIIPFVL